MCQVLSQFNPPLQQLRDRNMSMGIVLIEVIGTSDTLIHLIHLLDLVWGNIKGSV